MREILFRGKQLDDGEWVEGFYTLLSDNHGMKPTIITGTGKGCFIPEFIDPKTVGQYTGLKDKNGTKIFEGDIVKPVDSDTSGAKNWTTEFGKHHEICWVERDMQDFFGTVYIGFEIPLCAQSEFIEVIGNIHDNPELLESSPC